MIERSWRVDIINSGKVALIQTMTPELGHTIGQGSYEKITCFDNELDAHIHAAYEAGRCAGRRGGREDVFNEILPLLGKRLQKKIGALQ